MTIIADSMTIADNVGNVVGVGRGATAMIRMSIQFVLVILGSRRVCGIDGG